MGLITTQVTVGDGLTDTYIATDLNHSAVTRVRIDIWNNIGFDFPILKDGITSVDVDQTSLASSDPIENLVPLRNEPCDLQFLVDRSRGAHCTVPLDCILKWAAVVHGLQGLLQAQRALRKPTKKHH
eukprot:TRINITY_DN6149_c0_g2_i8.p1 TRINITY_DN6149_c0_g2~~TRINITY_DN6149_c0_g2_i8.p1  ORF type:complete len:127 (+),score=9.04 TRINITY_DN6149_c0_g2_i8:289-669(+)